MLQNGPVVARRAAASRGFTLVELMITLVVVSVLLALAVPGYRQLVMGNRITNHTNTLLSDMSLARSEAINRSERVVICSGGGTCPGVDAWEGGWTVFVDRNGDDDLDNAAGENDTLILQRGPLEGVSNAGDPRTDGFTIERRQGPNDNVVAFGSSGAAIAGSGTALQLCGSSGDRSASNGVFINGTGTARQLADTDDDGIVNLPSGGDISTCP